jgi:hypothetical protein
VAAVAAVVPSTAAAAASAAAVAAAAGAAAAVTAAAATAAAAEGAQGVSPRKHLQKLAVQGWVPVLHLVQRGLPAAAAAAGQMAQSLQD